MTTVPRAISPVYVLRVIKRLIFSQDVVINFKTTAEETQKKVTSFTLKRGAPLFVALFILTTDTVITPHKEYTISPL